MIVYRVEFGGAQLSRLARSALTAAGIVWEGTDSAAARLRHRALVQACSEGDATAAVQAAVRQFGRFDDFGVAPVRDFHGKVWSRPLIRTWDQIDWSASPRGSLLSTSERNVLGALLDAAEPTWLIARDRDVRLPPKDVLAILERLQRQGLVSCSIMPSGAPGQENSPESWWALTDEVFDLFGLIKSPGYR